MGWLLFTNYSEKIQNGAGSGEKIVGCSYKDVCVTHQQILQKHTDSYLGHYQVSVSILASHTYKKIKGKQLLMLSCSYFVYW